MNPCRPSSEMHLRNFPDHTEFQTWIVNFRTEVCSKAKHPTRALQWVKEIEAAISLDDLITPKSITGQDFPDYEELDLIWRQHWKRCYESKHTSERRSVSRSTELRRTTEFPEGDKLLIWSMNISTLETKRHQRKKRRTQEYLASNQPFITSEGDKVKSKHPLLYKRENDILTTNARKVWKARPATWV